MKKLAEKATRKNRKKVAKKRPKTPPVKTFKSVNEMLKYRKENFGV